MAAVSGVEGVSQGVRYRDLNGNGVMDPYEDPSLSTGERVADLLTRMTLAEKVGLMFQNATGMSSDGGLDETGAAATPVRELITERWMNHFNVMNLAHSARDVARWTNAVQAVAEGTRLGIPVTISTDPRHGFIENSATSFASQFLSAWPESLGMAAIGSVDTVRSFAEVARQEYLALGIRAALHPTVDLATEPRWARQSTTFGASSTLAADFVRAYLDGFQGPALGPRSIACTTKHFPGGGPQRDGEDPHFPYGREQVYPGGRFAEHLAPFIAAIEHGTAQIMPYYGMPVGLELGGRPIEEVGFGYNHQIVTGLLREELGYDGVVVTDWNLVTDSELVVPEEVSDFLPFRARRLPARAHGVESLDRRARVRRIVEAGCDQFGGEEITDVLISLVQDGEIPESRIDESARRLLTVKFDLGLFDDPFVDESAADEIVGRSDFVAAGRHAQSESVTVLMSGSDRVSLPLAAGTRVHLTGQTVEAADYDGPLVVVENGDAADVVVHRLTTPWEPRDEYLVEHAFHAGSLAFAPKVVSDIASEGVSVPTIVDVFMDRPALVAPLLPHVDVLIATFGVSAPALLDALGGRPTPVGRLPFEIPRDMESIGSYPDVAGNAVDAVFPIGHRDDLSRAHRAIDPA